MKKRSKILIVLALVLLTVGCSVGGKDSSETIVIGSKNFTESIIVGELYRQALEENGYVVEHKRGLGGTPIIFEAMLVDEVDIMSEYTSTGLSMVLKTDPEFDEMKAYEKVKKGYEDEYNIIWLDKSELNNSQGLALTKSISDELSFTKLSQLAEMAPEIRLASTPEFEERSDGLKGLEDELGDIEFKDLTVYDKGIKYQVLRNGEADMNICFTTDADLAKGDIIALEDDMSFWPPYNLAPIIRGELLESQPGIEDILNEVSSNLTDEVIQKLNANVDIEGEEYEDVARDALKKWGIIS